MESGCNLFTLEAKEIKLIEELLDGKNELLEYEMREIWNRFIVNYITPEEHKKKIKQIKKEMKFIKKINGILDEYYQGKQRYCHFRGSFFKDVDIYLKKDHMTYINDLIKTYLSNSIKSYVRIQHKLLVNKNFRDIIVDNFDSIDAKKKIHVIRVDEEKKEDKVEDNTN